MPTITSVPLDGLAQKIELQMSELEKLRKEYEARQARVAKLNEKKDLLGQRLRQLDAEIEAVSEGKTLPRRPGRPPSAKIATQNASAAATPPKRMADLLVDLVGEATSPLTAKPLADELQKRGFFTASPNLPRIVQVRLNELVHKGILRRAQGQPGVVLGKSIGNAKRSSASSTGRKKARKKRAAPKAASSNGADGRQKAPLRSIVSEILAKSTQPLPARQLAEQVKAQGYTTKSKNLTNVMWVMLGKMENVENVPGKGYRLKR